jgi:hypothetical protein
LETRVSRTVPLHHLQSSLKTKFPEMRIEGIMVIIKQHTSTFQTPFSSNQVKQKEIGKNKFGCKTSTQHNLTITQPFLKPKPTMDSASRDLPKACIYFAK